MSALDRLIATPQLVQIDGVDLALPIGQAWELVRHGNLASSPLVRALFALRTLPTRLAGHDREPLRLCIDELVSSVAQPGFQLLVDDAPSELVVGAIGKVWQPSIAFAHVPNVAAFAAFAQPDYIKVAWSIRLEPLGACETHVSLELRVDATDIPAWRKFRAYFAIIGPASHFIRRAALAGLAREHGTPESRERERPMPGDDLLPDALGQLTDGITIAASPEAIWPWLVQMGGQRAGFYSYDFLDHGGRRSARELHPELQTLAVGDIIPATPRGHDGFEVLALEPARVLILGGLFDAGEKRQLTFSARRPAQYWQMTWAFILEPVDETHTRLSVRARAACSQSGHARLSWIRPVHHFMEQAQLRHLAARAEGRLARDDVRDVLEGLSGAGIMTLCLLTPFLRDQRNHWGVTREEAARDYPGDELIQAPLWQWTHGIQIEAPAQEVWAWIAQLGADRGAFYSYQWLENLAGCNLRNAESIHPEWQVHSRDQLRLHAQLPGLPIVLLKQGHYFVAHDPADEQEKTAGRPWVAASWLFSVEPAGESRCRLISRFRVDCSDNFSAQLSFGPTLLEPVGFAMDRRMLMGIKQRAETRRRALAPKRASLNS
jgi:hypothetical protein